MTKVLKSENVTHGCMAHSGSGLVKVGVLSHPVEESYGKEMVKNQIHDPLHPPLQEDVCGLGSLQPKGIIIMEVVGHISLPAMMQFFVTDFLITGFSGFWIHTLSDLHQCWWIVSWQGAPLPDLTWYIEGYGWSPPEAMSS